MRAAFIFANHSPARRRSPISTREAVTALKVITFGSTPVSGMYTNQTSALFTPPTLAKALITMMKLMVSPFPGLVSADRVAERVPLSVDELGGPAGGRLVEVDVCDLLGPSVAHGVQLHCFRRLLL